MWVYCSVASRAAAILKTFGTSGADPEDGKTTAPVLGRLVNVVQGVATFRLRVSRVRVKTIRPYPDPKNVPMRKAYARLPFTSHRHEWLGIAPNNGRQTARHGGKVAHGQLPQHFTHHRFLDRGDEWLDDRRLKQAGSAPVLDGMLAIVRRVARSAGYGQND